MRLQHRRNLTRAFQCSSASRKFLNVSVRPHARRRRLFQCSSASRKFLNQRGGHAVVVAARAFSALQRAENSSISVRARTAGMTPPFSALQRAENSSINRTGLTQRSCRYFQCSSASRKFLNLSKSHSDARRASLSVLFSEPKIPQFDERVCPICGALHFQCSSASRKFLNARNHLRRAGIYFLSVLFSEPKIPQS